MDSDPGWYAWGLDDLRAVDAEPYDFQLVDYNPVFKRQYHLAHREQEWANDWVKKLEKAGIVGEIESPYAAPVIVAPKKDEHGAWTDLRYAVDYRGLNERTIRDQYPCPTADELMTRMEGASRFTATDCTKAFHQRRVSDKPSGPDGLSAQQRLAFHAGNRLLTFKRMPFGHKNCVAAWQRVVDQALAGACLSQVTTNGVEYAVSFASRMNTPVEADLSSYEGEVGAVVWAVQRFRYYLEGHKYVIVIVEHFSKWIELVPVRDLEATTTVQSVSMSAAFERALQAQQRDVVRYRKVRRGDVQPRRHRFEIGSYVYVAQPPLNTLDVRTARTILRVVEILESGWLRLSGSDGNEIQVHMDNCAPCHLSNLVPARPIARGKA
eukprot:jgi/Tetstr1/457718/TSEL_004249.t1